MITALVTGANRGMGLEFCRQLIARGDTVIATCRRPSAELKALPVGIFEDVEMTSDQSSLRLARDLVGVRIDWLILNAGTFRFFRARRAPIFSACAMNTTSTRWARSASPRPCCRTFQPARRSP